ncbi:MAG: hypothetical protein KatS3mg111_2163 [Pirellulaceae bacterium]|nr:MAG: hypothetical protein KatS3mg111_2163 [Pirellulaceae bacterium]
MRGNRLRPEVGFLGEGNPIIPYQRVVVLGSHNGHGSHNGLRLRGERGSG